jgi:hypothetical protein
VLIYHEWADSSSGGGIVICKHIINKFENAKFTVLGAFARGSGAFIPLETIENA